MNRRNLFKLFSAGAAATVLPSVAPPPAPVLFRAAPGTLFTADMLAKESCEIMKAHIKHYGAIRIREPIRILAPDWS